MILRFRSSMLRTESFLPRLCCAMALALGIPHAVLPAHAAITTSGDVAPAPPVGGGPVAGPFRVGNTGLGTISISGGTALTNSSAAVVGDAEAGIGIVTMNGSGSDWTLTTAGADLTVGNNGTGSISISNFAEMNVNDDSFFAAQVDSFAEVSISGLGTIWNNGDDMNIGQRGQAVFEIVDGARLLSDSNILGDDATGDGWMIVSDQFSLWRADSTLTVADAGRALLQVLDGGRVENTSAIIANLAGSTGTVEVAGLGSLWQNATSLTIGESGHGTLLITDGGRVTAGSGINLTTIGSATTGTGFVEVRGLDSLWSVGGFLQLGDSGTGTLRILEGGRVTSVGAILGDNAGSRGEVLVDGDGSRWEVAGELTVADPGEAHLTISNGGIVSSSSLTRVAAQGRLTLDGGRLEIGSATGLLNTGIVEGGGTIEGVVANNAGGQLRVDSGDSLVLRNTLTNTGLVDVQSGELEVFGATTNNGDIDARDGAVLRFRSTGLDNNNNSQLAITSGIVDVFGNVDNNAGAEIVVGADASAIFHDVLTNSGDLIVMPGSDVLMLENLGFGGGSSLNVVLDAIDLPNDEGNPNDGFGQVQVAGTATLAGTLDVNLAAGYAPMLGDEFEILIADGGRSGVFANESLPALGGGLDWNVLYNPNSVVLAVVAGAAVPGDYNQNGIVDAADYTVWRNTLGSITNLVADGNGNNAIDTGDYQVWKQNFGRTSGAGAGTAVPEPSSSMLLAAVLLGWLGLRRRLQDRETNGFADVRFLP
ncbi:MAG: PEP-CTERM sorting domain-containing protein [Pirellulales bacterium]